MPRLFYVLCVIVPLSLWLAGCGTPAPSKTPAIPAAVFHLAQTADLPNSISIDLVESRGYLFAPVYINRQPAGLFMLDTGATLTVVDTGVVGRLRLPRLGGDTTLGVGGKRDFDWHAVQSVSFGDVVALPERRVAGLSLYNVTSGIGVPVGGILGYRSFGQVPYTIDYPARRLTMHRREFFTPPASAHTARVIRFYRLPVVEATLGDPDAGRKVWLIVDTGAHNDLTLPASLRTAWPEILATPAHGPVRTRGVGGVVQSSATWVERLNVMGVSLRDVETHFEPTQTGFRQAPVPVGRIGNGLLRYFVLSFDPQRDVLHAAFQPGKAGVGPDNALPTRESRQLLPDPSTGSGR